MTVAEYSVVVLAIVVLGGYLILQLSYFIKNIKNKTLTEDDLSRVNNWLLQAVVAAEEAFGSKTGQLKLSSVYAKFEETFPNFAKIIKFDDFSALVDKALVIVKNMASTNDALKKIFKTE